MLNDSDHSFIMYAKFSEKQTFLTYLPKTNVCFSENFAYVLNERSQK